MFDRPPYSDHEYHVQCTVQEHDLHRSQYDFAIMHCVSSNMPNQLHRNMCGSQTKCRAQYPLRAKQQPHISLKYTAGIRGYEEDWGQA